MMFSCPIDPTTHRSIARPTADGMSVTARSPRPLGQPGSQLPAQLQMKVKVFLRPLPAWLASWTGRTDERPREKRLEKEERERWA